MNRRLAARLGRLEEAVTVTEDGQLCAFHGPACQMGAEPLSDLYRLIIEAKRQMGEDVPPLDEHRPATPAEAAEYRRGYEEALAAAKAKNARMEAEILGGQDYQ